MRSTTDQGRMRSRDQGRIGMEKGTRSARHGGVEEMEVVDTLEQVVDEVMITAPIHSRESATTLECSISSSPPSLPPYNYSFRSFGQRAKVPLQRDEEEEEEEGRQRYYSLV